jgi:hypothetical protein
MQNGKFTANTVIPMVDNADDSNNSTGLVTPARQEIKDTRDHFFQNLNQIQQKKLQKIDIVESTKKNTRYIIHPNSNLHKVWGVVSLL